MESQASVVPELAQGESYHVFCSYSSTDQQWTQSLIQQLEDRGLRVCDHERDFMVGRPIVENMSECIEQSQKVLMVLSAEFVRSRWCLLEANMSMFRDCLQRKPIVPVLLQRDVHIPLHLSHLSYLDIQNPDFIQQLLRVLWTPNQELQASTATPYHFTLYNGKSLQPLPAVNERQLMNKLDCGVWSNMVPDQLSLIIQRPERYREAIGLVNMVSQKKVRFRSYWKLFIFALIAALIHLYIIFLIYILLEVPHKNNMEFALKIVGVTWLFIILIVLMGKVFLLRKTEIQRIKRELQKAVGRANSVLFEEKVLMGSESNSKLLLVYVSVDGCRQELSAESQDDQLFQKALLEYSCSYARSLSKRYFTFRPVSHEGHMEGTVCFCQYVRHRPAVKSTWWRRLIPHVFMKAE